ncbi:M23 family metallopeptidase [uncultured Aquimarina sp.]|uniref:M23 family metallopeptidase n=1 Tax=uncultured Aquimarina sp. TaxID=575652 RepID=UPI0026238926|nr:M23 family metallopeptidase [uncultured Aquimarina sp.]
MKNSFIISINKKILFINVALFLLIPFVTFSFDKINFSITSENHANGIHLYAANKEVIPVSVKIQYTQFINVESTRGLDVVYVIPANSPRYLITTLMTIDNSRKSSIKYRYSYQLGNHYAKQHDFNVLYHLPFENKGEVRYTQGYHGKTTHENSNAIDFAMPVNSGILAARGGIVAAVEERFSKNCYMVECVKYNNYIFIYHNDGTFGKYLHIKKDGSIVKKGDIVKAGQHIGYSGNTGYSSGPHLHFEVAFNRLGEPDETIKTAFLTQNIVGEKSLGKTLNDQYRRTQNQKKSKKQLEKVKKYLKEYFVYKDSTYTFRSLLQEMNWQKIKNSTENKPINYVDFITNKKIVQNDSLINFVDIYWDDKYSDILDFDVPEIKIVQSLKKQHIFDYVNKTLPNFDRYTSKKHKSKYPLNTNKKQSLIYIWWGNKTLENYKDEIVEIGKKYKGKLDLYTLYKGERKNYKKIIKKYLKDFTNINVSDSYYEDILGLRTAPVVIFIDEKGIISQIILPEIRSNGVFDFSALGDYLQSLNSDSY